MDVLVLDCETICARDISQIAGEALVLCSANTQTKLPIVHGERAGVVAPNIPNGTDYLLISMLTKSLISNEIEQVEAVTKDAPLGCMIKYLCNVNDVECHVCKRLADITFRCAPAPHVKEREHQHLKRTIYHLFIARKLLTLCAISTSLGVRPSTVKRVIDELTVEKKIKQENGLLWRLLE